MISFSMKYLWTKFFREVCAPSNCEFRPAEKVISPQPRTKHFQKIWNCNDCLIRFVGTTNRSWSRTSRRRIVASNLRRIVGWRPSLCQGYHLQDHGLPGWWSYSDISWPSLGWCWSQTASRSQKRSASRQRSTQERWAHCLFPSKWNRMFDDDAQVKKPVIREWCYKPSDLRSPSSRAAISQILAKVN